MNKQSSIPTLVLFGRPGSGKTTVATAAVDMVTSQLPQFSCLALDLDVCVPRWMRDNFARGIYPNLQERQDFAISCCDYVDACFEECATDTTMSKDWVSIISFSFVNTDLRETFRFRFPSAQWVLLETNEVEATKRISQREGHFYNGQPPAESKGSSPNMKTATTNDDNSDWNFAPVDFPHVVLMGDDPIEANAASIVRLMENLVVTTTRSDPTI